MIDEVIIKIDVKFRKNLSFKSFFFFILCKVEFKICCNLLMLNFFFWKIFFHHVFLYHSFTIFGSDRIPKMPKYDDTGFFFFSNFAKTIWIQQHSIKNNPLWFFCASKVFAFSLHFSNIFFLQSFISIHFCDSNELISSPFFSIFQLLWSETDSRVINSFLSFRLSQ